MKGRILLAEDDASVRKTLIIGLEARGYEIVAVGTGEEALELAEAREFDVVIADVGLPGISGIDVMLKLRAGGRPVILISGASPAETVLEGVLAGAESFLSKPFEFEELLWLIERGLRAGMRLPAAQDEEEE